MYTLIRRTKLNTRVFWRVAIAAALTVPVLACNVSLPITWVATPTPFPTPTPPPLPPIPPITPDSSSTTPAAELTAGDVSRQAAMRMAEVQSFHFSVQPSGNEVNIGSLINLPMPVLLTGIEGDIVQPDQLRARIKVTILGVSAHLDLIRYQGDVYLSNPLTGKWEKLPREASQSFSPSLLFNPDQGLLAWLPMLEFQMVGFDAMQGELAYHLKADDVPGVNVTGFGGESKATIEVWIGMQTFLLYQAKVSEHDAKSKGTTSWLLTLSAFDRPVKITPPAVQ